MYTIDKKNNEKLFNRITIVGIVNIFKQFIASCSENYRDFFRLHKRAKLQLKNVDVLFSEAIKLSYVHIILN